MERKLNNCIDDIKSLRDNGRNAPTNSHLSDAFVNELKETFSEQKTKLERLKILTTIPIDWGIKKMRTIFGISRRLARQAKQLRQKGFASVPFPKRGHPLPESTAKKVKNFYLIEASSIRPGMKDCISVLKDGKRTLEQKRLLNGNLKTLHSDFLSQNPDVKISLSKFSKLRPPQCVLANHTGMHNVCVCKTHENMRFKLLGIQRELKAKNVEFSISLSNILNKMVCDESRSECYLLTCEHCPGTTTIFQELKSIFEANNVTEVIFDEWTTGNR